MPEPRLKFDRQPHPDHPDVVEADCSDLPLPSASLHSIVFDPPFRHCDGEQSLLGQRFSERDVARYETNAMPSSSGCDWARASGSGKACDLLRGWTLDYRRVERHEAEAWARAGETPGAIIPGGVP